MGHQDMSDTLTATHRPLVISLESALLETDAGDEIFLDTLRSDPKQIIWSAGGNSIAPSVSTIANVAHWPVNSEAVEHARLHAAAGGVVALATQGNVAIAEAMRDRFPFISDIVSSAAASDTADDLCRHFPDGFDFIGRGSARDQEIWRRGVECRTGGTDSATSVAPHRPGPIVIHPRSSLRFSVLRRSMRLHQWAKNALVFVPLVLGGKAAELDSWLIALLGFTALCAVASATYLINDIWDLPSDRRHWSKYKRPIASGELRLRTALAMASLALVGGLLIAASISPWALLAVATYVTGTLAYSFALKRVPILDVLLLAGLFTLRLGYGVILTDVRLSPWLLVFSMFTFTSLSLAKRHVEVARLAENGMMKSAGRGWLVGDAPLILGLGVASAMGGITLLILYLIEDAFPKQFYHHPQLLWTFPALLFLFLGRIWLMCQRNQLSDDPVAFALKDKTCLTIGLVGGFAFLLAIA